jgi:hypothetical protein
LPEAGEYPYAFCVGTKAALILGGGGITGGMYELGALSAMDDFIVSGRKSGEFDLYVGISAGSILTVLQQFLPAGFFSNANLEQYVARTLSGEGRTNGHGMEVSLERLAADRFLQQAVVPAGRRRSGLKRQQSMVPVR